MTDIISMVLPEYRNPMILKLETMDNIMEGTVTVILHTGRDRAGQVSTEIIPGSASHVHNTLLTP